MKKVLIVDDSASIRQMLEFTLKRSGYEVLAATDAQAALTKAEGQACDLVISDVNMPGMDGYSFVAELRKKSAYKFTPILMLTTESSAEQKTKGKQAGATGWLVKPFNPEQLVATIEKVLNR
ncbi:MAG: response regulator [Pseudomonadales bacterium]|uniref:Chemotaxis regulator-transmits chemoreceptor signals to flagelllar motor components CheY n=1 Tax=Oleiphilus messinensis TaxID=141451 RepID=A0A1Y0I235_9GAMM|nr:response regulator [Oleiphilus messinensis]ARU54522.1 chemotaxis regulator - transmits chemoreceptor signals to flagelllar motor components CheY [Oleiphilus messinensis]MCG8612175.1 response regulator [Pseudomonadales bacterium]